MFKLRSLQQSLEQEETEHKATKAKLADKNKVDQSIEEANSEALKGKRVEGHEVWKTIVGCLKAWACGQ